MIKTFCTGLAGLLLLTACASRPATTELPWDDRLHRGTLSNGLEYWLLPDHSQPGRVDLRLLVKAGSVDESGERTGVAHLLEHLSFYQRGSLPGTVRQSLLAAGWKQGQNFNAVTSNDRTQYFFSPAAGKAQLELGLQALATIGGPVDFTAADLQQERPIVLEEWRGGLGVAQRMNEQRRDAQRVGSRYVNHPPIGSKEGIETAQWADLSTFHQRWYVPGNMQLVITGDIDPATLPARLDHWFGQLPTAATPTRDYLELPLRKQLNIAQVQDSQSGGSNVALMFRFHEADARAATTEGMRQRLINRLVLSLAQQQLVRQGRENDSGVRSLTLQKHLIGQASTVLAVGAGVSANGHESGLQKVLEEIARLRRNGFDEQQFQEQKAALREVAQSMLKKGDDRDFVEWVRRLNDAAVQDNRVVRPSTIANLTLHLLDDIRLTELNQRWNDWTDQPDRVLQYQAPGLTPVQLPSVEHVESTIAQWRAAPLPPAPAKVEEPAELPSLPIPQTAGQVVSKQHFDAEQVEHWQLSNGDRLVWLKRAGAGGKAQLRIDSPSGYLAKGLVPWQAQTAAQLLSQSAPQGWNEAQLKRWRSTQDVSLGLSSEALRLTFTGQASGARLEPLLALYNTWQTHPWIDPQAMDDSLEQMRDGLSRQTDSVSLQQTQALARLRFAPRSTLQPDAEQLATVSQKDLLDQWQRMSRSPVTYYLMSDVDAQQLEAGVTRYLANIPRGQALSSRDAAPLAGARRKTLAVALEPRANLQAYSFSEMPWSPTQAAAISLLGRMAQEDLKAKLRGEAGGVYRLAFDSELGQDTQRIDSRLAFTTDPQRLDELRQMAADVLAQLPQRINAESVAALRKQLQAQERERLNDPQTQLHRLILSERAYGDPRYLSEQRQLAQSLQPATLKALAKHLWNPANLRELQVLPATGARP
ncbi:M16 family metallopeptidase [Pseudomonas vanderleydeniana]|uniref:Insulinase family protein n=1 Tax=Pseudomonas vanderleydeniana TaxID=2745495 RepID=A0A9E6PG90_9PSED|nr:M16 family metallopeptidase [Pseudomonas vanderleydeniana]QXI25986.1 insulinase family protein [Pseudomonas vanderleydeniana]